MQGQIENYAELARVIFSNGCASVSEQMMLQRKKIN